MLIPKSFYFFFFAAMASLLPYLALYYEGLGLSGSQIGVLAAALPLVSLVSAPLWGGFADATRQHKRLLLIATSASLAAVWLLSLSVSFASLLPTVIVYAFFFAPIIPLVDNSVLEMLGEQRARYGRLRVWGAVGWGLAAPLTGLLVEWDGLRWAFNNYLLLMCACTVVSFALPILPSPASAPFGSGLRLLLTNRQWILFLSTVFIVGLSLALVNNFLFLHLEDLDASRALMGVSLSVATLSEVPILFFADRLLRRWGAQGLLVLSLLALVARMLAYSYLQAPSLVLLVQLLHGPTFATAWIAGVSYANQIAPPHMGATAQGIFSGVVFGVGAAAGALLGGFVYEAAGAAAMFRLAAFVTLFGFAIFVIARRKPLQLPPT